MDKASKCVSPEVDLKLMNGPMWLLNKEIQKEKEKMI